MEGLLPDHWTIFDFRRESSTIMKDFLRCFRKSLTNNNYATYERVILDGTKVKADAKKKCSSPKALKKVGKHRQIHIGAFVEIRVQ